MIKLQIVGNLGKDCIVKEVNGKNVINFRMRHTEIDNILSVYLFDDAIFTKVANDL